MLRTALALLSSLQIGARLKLSVETYVRQAIVAAVALVFFLLSVLFGLVALYHLLISFYAFTPEQAAGIVAGGLLVIALLALACLPLVKPKPVRASAPSMLVTPAEGLGVVDQQLGRAMQQVGPITLLAIAFAAGLLASRRR